MNSDVIFLHAIILPTGLLYGWVLLMTGSALPHLCLVHLNVLYRVGFEFGDIVCNSWKFYNLLPSEMLGTDCYLRTELYSDTFVYP